MSLRKSCFTLFLVALTVLAALPLHSMPVPLTARQLAAGSPHVVVAVVEDARSQWNAERTLIVTEYDLRIEDRLKGDAPERVTLTVPGGTVGEERHLTSVSTFLETGTRYLLFLEDFDRPTLSPVTGAWQGVYAESGVSGSGSFGGTLAAARELLAEVEAHPKASDTAWRAPRAEDPTLPAKTWDSRSAKFVVLDPATVPIAWNLIQPGQRFFHVDWDMMAYWNVYAELFTGTNRPSPTWAFGNNVFDIAGFPTSEQLQQQVGAGWNSGTAFTTFLRILNGRTVEADLAFNPAFQWTLDDNEATQPGGPFSFRHLMLGGLGFAWGYQGLFDPTKPAPQGPIAVDTVMSFGVPAYSLATLLAEDAKAARSTYPAVAKSLRDGLISSYNLKASGSELTYVPVQAGAPSVRAGKGFKLLNPVKIENPGTEILSNPNVKVYLVPQRFSMDGAILLKTFKFRGKIDSGETKTLALSQVKVPASVPAGSYYFAFVLDVPGDAYPANNRAWSNHDVKITVTRR
jgi:hypothetical protein